MALYFAIYLRYELIINSFATFLRCYYEYGLGSMSLLPSLVSRWPSHILTSTSNCKCMGVGGARWGIPFGPSRSRHATQHHELPCVHLRLTIIIRGFLILYICFVHYRNLQADETTISRCDFFMWLGS